jgi:hypothetical protein
MGQRTQLVLKTKDRFGTVVNKVYHEQWGFAKTMPMIILEFLIDLHYGRASKTTVIRSKMLNSLDDLKDIQPCDVKQVIDEIDKTSIHKLELSSLNTSNEYEDDYMYFRGNAIEKHNERCIQGVIGENILHWDFDINDPNNVRFFTGDNNDGLALISIEEVVENHYESSHSVSVNYNVSVGFLVSEYETRRGVNRYHDIVSYTKQWKDYCPAKTINAIKTLYELFEINQLGKK